MSTSLTQLAAWAAIGWHIFPLAPNSKLPAKGSHGLNDATTDVEIIKRWHEACPSANWGINCGKSGLVVLDVDSYKPGAKAAFDALALDLGVPDTLTVATPGGGAHYYYQGVASSSVAKIGPGIDTRGQGGYVVLPDSTIDGKPYHVARQEDMARMPTWIADKAGRAAEPKVEAAPTYDLDQPAAIDAARHYLRADAPPAIEGQGGDMKTLHTAMLLKDMGVSQEQCLELMLSEYNPRCDPPWDDDQLERKVANAYRYGKSAPGVSSVEASGFKPVEPDPFQEAPDEVMLPAVPTGPLALRASTFDPATVPPRPWVLGYDLMKGFLTATIAQGGVGKSMIAMIESLSVATGKSLAGVQVFKKGPAWIYNTEDPMDELQRRVLAATQHYGLSREDVHDVHVSSGRSNPLILAKSERGVVHVNRAMIDTVCKYIQENKILTWCVDPFVHTHYCDENSNSEMAIVLQAFGQIAEQTGAAINLVHHTSKGSTGTGEMDKARGASAFGGAVRIMRHAQTMSVDDCEDWGVDPSDRKKFIGLYDAKGNMSPPADSIRWFEKVSVILPNGDNVGTVKPCGLTKVASKDVSRVRDNVFKLIRIGNLENGDEISASEAEAFDGGVSHVPDTSLQIRVNEKDGKYFVRIEPHVEWLDEK